MESWKDTGKDYIYHIEVGKYVYVGQSRASKEGSRLKYRLQAPFRMTNITGDGTGSAT